MVRDREVERIARTESDAQRAAETLVDAANAAGGEDNITVIVLDVVEVDAAEAPDPVALAEDDAAEPGPPAAEEPVLAATGAEVPPKAVRERGARLRGVRGALLVLVPLVVIATVATAAIGWYARRSYFVGEENGRVVIYKGVPGGVLGWDPTIDLRTRLLLADLDEVDRERVSEGAARGSFDRAQAFVDRLQDSIDSTSTTTRSSTTTSRPLRTTTTTAAVTPTT
jgi:protein phosphatase